MKYAKVFDDRSFDGVPLTKERLLEDGIDEKKADEILEMIEMKKNILNEFELVSVKAISKDGTYKEMLEKEMLSVEIPKDLYDELKKIEKLSGDNLDHVTEMLLRAGLDIWNKKFKPKE